MNQILHLDDGLALLFSLFRSLVLIELVAVVVDQVALHVFVVGLPMGGSEVIRLAVRIILDQVLGVGDDPFGERVVVAQDIIYTLSEVAGWQGYVSGMEHALGGGQTVGAVAGGTLADGIPKDLQGSMDGLPDFGAGGHTCIKKVGALAIDGGARPGAVGGRPDVTAEGFVDMLVEGLVLAA